MQGDRIRKVAEGQIVCAIERPPRPLGRFVLKLSWSAFGESSIMREFHDIL